MRVKAFAREELEDGLRLAASPSVSGFLTIRFILRFDSIRFPILRLCPQKAYQTQMPLSVRIIKPPEASIQLTMLKKPKVFLTLIALLGGVILYVNKDWFRARPIQISHRFYAFGGRFDSGGVAPLMFEFDRKLKLTSIKVVPLSSTNKTPQPVWHLVSDSSSVPTRGFLYGMEVPGMHPALKGEAAAPLDPAEKYRLLLEAGSVKGQHDFDLDPSAH